MLLATAATLERSADPSCPLGRFHSYEEHIGVAGELSQGFEAGER
jgi:hypothetical protein